MTKTRSFSGHAIASANTRTACLVEIHGANLGRTYPLDRRSASVGRAPDNAVVLDTDSVSRHHCTVRPQGLGFSIVDDGSTNGTFVNERRVGEERRLRPGDMVRIGSTVLKFLGGDASSGLEARYHDVIYRQTITDGLTQVHNRRYLIEFLEREVARCSRHGGPLSVLLLDIDHFKAINDTKGHLAGDFVLRELAALLQTRVRHEECLARYGGEEFCIVLPEVSLDAAVQRANALRIRCAGHDFDFDGSRIQVTFSCGAIESHRNMSALYLLKHADERLYEAKRNGRNRVCCEPHSASCGTAGIAR